MNEGERAALLLQLRDRDNKTACAASAALLAESRASAAVYPHLAEIAPLLGSKNSLARNRAVSLLCANARWDAAGRLDALLPQLLALLGDERPITVRVSLAALPELAAAKPALRGAIRAAAEAMPLEGLPDSMRPLIEKDRAALLRALDAMEA